jgi:aflatoxin B1 aldehyde reductase
VVSWANSRATRLSLWARASVPTCQGKLHHGQYCNDTYFYALEMVQEAVKKHGLTVGEATLRWLEQHSGLKQEQGDAVIVSASSVKHSEDTIVDLEKEGLWWRGRGLVIKRVVPKC